MLSPKLLTATYNIVRVMAARERPPAVTADKLARERARGVPSVAQEFPPLPTTSQVDATCPIDVCLRADIELSRICLGLKLAPQFRYWLILNQLRRDTGHQGFTRQQLTDALTAYGVKNGAAYMTRLLYRGHGLFWNIHRNMVYPVGYTELARRIVRKAYTAGLHDLYIDNMPGIRRDMYLSVSGAAADFEAQILAGWYAARGNPTISRYTLELLTNRDSRSLRYLERRAGITIQYNEAESLDPVDVPLNEHGEKRSDVYRTIDGRGNTVWHWRLPNTYQSTIIRQHDKRGAGRRTASILKQWFETIQLTGNIAAGANSPGKLNRMKLNYCITDKDAKRRARRCSDTRLLTPDRPHERGGVVWRVYRSNMYTTQSVNHPF